MSRRRFENLDPERQTRLFDSAAEEFGAHGYDGASLNRIIDRAGMSKSSLYYYFDDKADLFTTLVQRSIAFLFKEVGGLDVESLTAETYWSEIEAVIHRAVAQMNRDVWWVKLGRMLYRLRGDAKHGAPTERAFAGARRWIAALIARGQKLGVVRADLPESMLIDAVMGLGEALDRWAVAHWDELSSEARLAMARAQIGLFRRLLSP